MILFLEFFCINSSYLIKVVNGIQYESYDNKYTYILGKNDETLIKDLVFESAIDNLPVIRIVSNAFKERTDIVGKITLPKSLKEIGNNAFSYCTFITGELIFPDDLKVISSSCFESTSITSIKFGENLEEIDVYAFKYCTRLSGEIDFPLSLKKIGDGAFMATNISKVICNINIESLGWSCFKYSKVESISIPQKITAIPGSFLEYSMLSGTLVIPDNVKIIGMNAFMGTFITSLVLPFEMEEIDSGAFSYNMFLSGGTTVFRAKIMEDNVFYCCAFTTIEQIVADEIGPTSFAMNSQITGSISVSVSLIQEGAFSFCPNLNGLLISNWDLELNIFYPINIPYLMVYGDTSLESIEIYGNVTNIGEKSFAFCENLKSVTISNYDHIEMIEDLAFYGCESLIMNLILKNYKNLTRIGNEAFYGCNSLVGEVAFPAKLESIGERAFASLHITGSVYIPDNVQIISSQAFFHCDSLSGSLYIGDGCYSIGESAFAMCTKLSGSLYIGTNITQISDYAFYGCEMLKGSLIFHSNLTEISGTLTLPSTLIKIGQYAFSSCLNLSGILTIPKSVQHISNSAFFGCIGFEEVIFENKETEVDIFAFSKLHNKCFDNVPVSFSKNDPEVYSSDNFAGKIIPESFLNMHCTYFYLVDTIAYFLTIIYGLGVFTIVFTLIISYIQSYLTNTKRLKIVFNEMITKIKESETDEDESTNQIINKINEYLARESLHKSFDVTKRQANKALISSLNSAWPAMFTENKEKIMKSSFNQITFYKCCCSSCKKNKCCKNKKRKIRDLSEISQETLL